MLAEAKEEGGVGVGVGESTLSGLWKHMRRDMASCINCVCAHHDAKKHYEKEYEEEVVAPMLGILKRLDEERVEGQLRRLRGGLGAGKEEDAAQLICVIFEVISRHLFPFSFLSLFPYSHSPFPFPFPISFPFPFPLSFPSWCMGHPDLLSTGFVFPGPHVS